MLFHQQQLHYGSCQNSIQRSSVASSSASSLLPTINQRQYSQQEISHYSTPRTGLQHNGSFSDHHYRSPTQRHSVGSRNSLLNPHPHAISRTASMCQPESYNSLQSYQQNALRRLDFLSKINAIQRDPSSPASLTNYGTLPRKSAFRATQPRSQSGTRANELEEYAKQYEDAYSRRLWGNRNGVQSVADSPGSNYRSATLPRKPTCSKPVAQETQKPHATSFHVNKKFFDHLDAQQKQDQNGKLQYSTMSLPRKMPVKKLVSVFNSQIENQNKDVPRFSTLQRRHLAREGEISSKISERRKSFHVSSGHVESPGCGSYKSGDFGGKFKLPEDEEERRRSRRSADFLVQDWKRRNEEVRK